MFHYTLNPGAILFLGESESIGPFSDLFVAVDARHKIFKRKPVDTGHEPGAEVGYCPHGEAVRKGKDLVKEKQADIDEIAERVILRDDSLPCVLVGEDYSVVYFNGDVNKFLIQPGGKPTVNILQMARPEIRYRLNLLLKRAFHARHAAVEKDVQVRVNDHYVTVDIVVRRIEEPGIGDNLVLVVFQAKQREKKPGEEETSPVDLPEHEKGTRIRELEHELQSTWEHLQTAIEELQSMNEELRTVNSEYQQKIDELPEAYDDLNNLLATTEVATLFLDQEMKIRWFTPAALKGEATGRILLAFEDVTGQQEGK